MFTHGYDTETTGLIDRKLDLMHPEQPRIVQLASMLCAEDGAEVDSFCVIIKPDGWEIDEGGRAFASHGITNERANREGIPLEVAMARFEVHRAAAGQRVAHNLSYDKQMVAREYNAAGMPHPDNTGIASFCTMTDRRVVEYCNIPSPNGYGPKWPKLTELHKHLFGEEFEGAHDAGNDLRATMRCFFELRRRGVL